MKIVEYSGDWSLHSVTQLVEYAAPACRQFTVVVAQDRENEATGILHDLMPYLVISKTVSAWPGTIKLDGEVRRMLKYSAEPTAIRKLVEDLMPVLFSSDPVIEDLAMLRADGRPFLIMITHEQEVFLKLEPQDYDLFPSVLVARDFQTQGDDEAPDEVY